MTYPDYYNMVESFNFIDKLSDFLGATDGGKIEINYLDCVKLAGHSCPTVAGSYIIAKEAQKALNITDRSSVKISFKEPRDSGVTGVIGTIIGYIFGCSDEGGFGGIGGKFNRASLVDYGNIQQDAMVEISSLDGTQKVAFNLDTSSVPAESKMMELMQKAIKGVATKDEKNEFKSLWQSRVETMLLNKELWSKIAQKI